MEVVDEIRQESDFREWAERLTRGEEQAYHELMRRYAFRLRALASARIGVSLRSKFDAEDIVQSVLRNFFANLHAGSTEMESSLAMRGLLALMVKRKCARYVARYKSAKRNVQREVADSFLKYGQGPQSREPSPEEAVHRADGLAEHLQRFDAQDRQIIESILNGESTASIAERLGTSQRTVQRTVRRVCLRLGGGK